MTKQDATMDEDPFYYIPLLQHKVDVEAMQNELDMHVPFGMMAPGCGLTVSKEFAGKTYGFDRFNGTSAFDQHGIRRVRSGERDEDIVHWPHQLEDSYIRRVGEALADTLGLPAPRVRMSLYIDHAPKSVGWHADPHTPCRAHIALKTGPTARWHFKHADGRELMVHQPADGIPVLIETGKTMHAVRMVAPVVRMHLWYQWYQAPDPLVIDCLRTKAVNSQVP